MPRTYQPPQAQASQSYGQKNEQLQAQRQMPLPQQPDIAPPAPQGAPQQDRPSIDDAIMQMATEYDPGITPLAAQSIRPDEPVTHGLAQGAGAGPEIFSEPSRALRTADGLQMLAQYTGSDRFAQMADKIRMRGGAR